MNEIIPGVSMSPLELLAVLAAVVLVVVRWLPAAARARVTVGAGAVLLVSAAVLAVPGIRWQLVPVLVGGGVALPFAVAPLMRTGRRVRWWLALPGTVAGVGLIATGPAAAWAFPVPVFPEPSGSKRGGLPAHRARRRPQVVAASTLAFLDATLRQAPGDLDRALSAYGSLSVHR
ncbi:hypothetical protein ACFYNO_31710 [Kitasatospora sp. NPDC006697]|uniref:hypothetical protein n=1 Tax=Kitasatospora sp. NPDC006697 TaxID=3364020 RepID=UPI0036AED868